MSKMRKLLFATVLLFSINLNAQSNLPLALEDPQMDAYLQKRKPATLTIQINNAPDSVKSVNVKCTFVSFGSKFQKAKYYSTNSNGFVRITLEQNLPYQQIWLDIDKYLYAGIYVNTDLKITVDVSKIKGKDGIYLFGEGLVYSGTDGEFNTVMNKSFLYKQNEKDELMQRLDQLCSNRRGNYSTDLFSKKIDSVWQALSNRDNELIEQYPRYGWAIKNESISEFYGNLCTSYWGDTMPPDLLNKMSKHKPYFTSNEGVLFYKYFFAYQTKRTRSIANCIKLIDSVTPQPRADILKTSLLERGGDSFAVAYPVIIKSMKTAWCKRLATSELNEATVAQKKINAVLASSEKLNDTGRFIGTPLEKLPFDATLYRLDKISDVNDFITNLKSKFKGKALIIDFWATWCGPCLSDMPYSRKLHESNKDLPVEYIYICTNNNSDMTIWKNKITVMQIPGVHIFMDDKIVTKLKTAFNVPGAGFPAYIVIDAKGQLRQNAIQHMELLDRDKLKTVTALE